MIPVDVREGSDRPSQTPARATTFTRETRPAVQSTPHTRTFRTVFPQPADGYAAVGRLRAVGFRIDLAGSIEGDLIVTIQAGRTRFDELGAIVAAHQGTIEPPP